MQKHCNINVRGGNFRDQCALGRTYFRPQIKRERDCYQTVRTQSAYLSWS